MNPGSPAAWYGKTDGVKHIGCVIRKRELVETSLEW